MENGQLDFVDVFVARNRIRGQGPHPIAKARLSLWHAHSSKANHGWVEK